ncbi:MAG: cytochrome c biogenesis protein CcsA [Candidatus Korarchaeota archaeon]|nr:cytochrome c biogenesis protein CcsA [Candidatus Korarchaeota archaeon]
MRKLVATLAVTSLADAATLWISQVLGPFPSVVPLGNPTAYRNLYVHVPISVSTYLLFTLGFFLALSYLLKGKGWMEEMAHSFILAGLVTGFSTLVTGMIWASESWGSAWNWDPRETGVLFMFLAFLVYLAVRSSIKDPDVRPKVSMAFAVAAYATIPLSFLVPYLMPSLHPTMPETSMFIRGGLTPLIFGGRIILVSLEGALLALLIRSGGVRGAKLAVIPVVLVAVLLLAMQLPPNLAGGETLKVQVISGTMENGTLHLKVRSSQGTYDLLYKGKPPINPLFVTFGGERRLTLEKHWLLVEGRVEDGTIVASSLKLIPYWGNPVNAMIYALTLFTLAYLAGRERK